ncbi:UvrD-helicase domain-containing protein [Botrimarina hoheduenensis]|uniref:DNA 3'-5' helicase n=1 Tax=Botrimarina hoheduenensis TaxID=2528000 RepID=A0A5C5WCZ9_9BACT|nr:UvrD-helicase domain-containing protein [Botrimarina hoheduenensis]TWT48544.1 ATP-dependent helicase/nuclease subunit A [Botrimarina hoheduenensis]
MSLQPYTDEQSAALAARAVSVALDAGAGCGKTFVLTERFLAYLDPGASAEPAEQRLKQIVAITFTEAAASELRARIRLRCQQRLAAAEPADRDGWRHLIRALDAARVSTIHSFCAGLVREYAVELGIDPAFRVLDPADATVLLGQAIDETLREALANAMDENEVLLLRLAADLDVTRLRDAIECLAEAAHETGFAAWLKRSPQQSVEAWCRVYATEIVPDALRTVRESACWQNLKELLPLMTPDDERADFIHEMRSAIAAAEKKGAGVEAFDGLRPTVQLERKTDRGGKKRLFLDRHFADTADRAKIAEEVKAVRKLVEDTPPLADEQTLLIAAEAAHRLQKIGAEAARRFRAAKRRRGVLDNDDLLTEAQRLLTDPPHQPLADDISQSVQMLMVDEFQDTDPVQTKIVRAIAGATHDTGGLFLVGDFKQSIYRFRGAQPRVFREIREKLPAAGRLPLSMNFRSQPGVIDFVNTLFAPAFGTAYQPLRARRLQLTERPCVEFLWTPRPDPPGDRQKPSADQCRRAEARSIAARLQELLSAETPAVVDDRSGQPRAARPGDIALLFRSHSDMGLYEDALREQGIDYYVVGGQAFYSQQEVYDIVNLLRTVDSRVDEIATLAVLRSPLFALEDETLLRLGQQGSLAGQTPGFKAPAGIDPTQAAAVERAAATLTRLKAIKDRVPVAELITTAIEATGYDAALLADFLGQRKLANLEKLIEQARQHDATGGDLAGFCRRLTRFTNATQPPKEAPASTTTDAQDVVRLMTFHASKGLEFPIVVLADLDRKGNARGQNAAYTPDLGPVLKLPDEDGKGLTGDGLYRLREKREEEQEDLRLLYVACTRAADRLLLSACLEDFDAPQGVFLKQIASRFDLASGALRATNDPANPAAASETAEAEPLVSVTPVAVETSGRREAARRGLDRALDSLGKGGPAPASLAPISLKQAETLYSVSRLNGSLQAFADADETALAEPATKPTVMRANAIDPLGFGTLVHAILEHIDPQDKTGAYHTQSAQQAALLAAELAPRYLLKNAEAAADEATKLTQQFLLSPRWEAMRRSVRLEREAEFLLRWKTPKAGPRCLLQGYLDAAYCDESGNWRIVDYKTNHLEDGPASLAQAAELYRFQLSLYALAMERSLGISPVELVLCFLRPGVEVRITWDEAARARAVEAVNLAIAASSGEDSRPLNLIALV